MIIDELRKYTTSCNISIYAINNEKVLYSYNENQIQDSACTLKVFIMLDYIRQIQEKKITGREMLEVTEENAATGAGTVKYLSYGMKICASDLVELMVSISDHMAANILIDFLGMEHINETIKIFGFKSTRLLKKYLVPRSKHVGETTAYDYATFFKMLDNNEFYNKEYCSYMKDILLSQRYKDFLAEPLLKYESYVDMQSKSGKVDGKSFDSLANSCVNDGGICITKFGNYYIAFLSEIYAKSNVCMLEMKNLMQIVSRKVFEVNLKNEANIC